MSSVLTIILAVIMALSPAAGSVVNPDQPFAYEAHLSLNADNIASIVRNTGAPMPEETLQTLGAVEDILNAITFEGTAGLDKVELKLTAGGDTLLTAGVKYDEKGAVIASSLLGSQVLTVTDETIRKMQEEQMNSAAQSFSFADFRSLMEAVRQLDKEQIEKDCVEAGDKLAAAIAEKMGETETGEYTVDGMAFTSMTPVNITYTEFMELLLNSFAEMVRKDSLKPVVQDNGEAAAEEIAKAIENLKSQPAEQQPAFTLTTYTDANGGNYYVCGMADREDVNPPAGRTEFHLGFGDAQGKKHLQANFSQGSQKMEMTATGDRIGEGTVRATIMSKDANAVIISKTDGTGNTDMVCNIQTKDTAVMLTANSTVMEDGRIIFAIKVYLGDTENELVSVTGTCGIGGALASVYEGEGITAVALEDLNDANGKAATQLKMMLAANVMKALVTLTKNLPEDSAEWVNTQIRQMMMPTTMKTAPTSTPAVEGE